MGMICDGLGIQVMGIGCTLALKDRIDMLFK